MRWSSKVHFSSAAVLAVYADGEFEGHFVLAFLIISESAPW